MVTNMEYDAAPTGIPASDMHTGIATGEWGCWVDPAVTRVIQAGIEHGRVPDVPTCMTLGIARLQGSLYGTDSQGNVFPISRTSTFEKLCALVIASLSPNAVEYRLQVSILLKGARGTGKMSTVRDVARYLGMHLLEVSL